MVHHNSLACAKFTCVLITLLSAMAAHASLSDCNAVLMDASTKLECSPSAAMATNTAHTPTINVAPASPAMGAAHSDFQIGHTRSAHALSETLSLLVLLSGLLVVVLVRAKRFNTK